MKSVLYSLRVLWCLLLIVPLSFASQTKMPFIATAAPDQTLQNLLSPWNQQANDSQMLKWTGGDVDASLQLDRELALWVYGDTLLGNWTNSTCQRRAGCSCMPHTSIRYVQPTQIPPTNHPPTLTHAPFSLSLSYCSLEQLL